MVAELRFVEGISKTNDLTFGNNPHGHRDDPPHVHMHLRWPANSGTKIGHNYLDDRGLLTFNRMGIKGLDRPARDYAKGETAITIGPGWPAAVCPYHHQEGLAAVGAAGRSRVPDPSPGRRWLRHLIDRGIPGP